MKEFEFKGKQFRIERIPRSNVLITDDFTATPKELRAVKQKLKETTAKDAAIASGIPYKTIKTQLNSFIQKNRALTGSYVSFTELAARAYHYELLDEITIVGLEKPL